MQEPSCARQSRISWDGKVFLPRRRRRLRISAWVRPVDRMNRNYRRLHALALQLPYRLGDETAGSIVVSGRIKGSQSEYVHQVARVTLTNGGSPTFARNGYEIRAAEPVPDVVQ